MLRVKYDDQLTVVLHRGTNPLESARQALAQLHGPFTTNRQLAGGRRSYLLFSLQVSARSAAITARLKAPYGGAVADGQHNINSCTSGIGRRFVWLVERC